MEKIKQPVSNSICIVIERTRVVFDVLNNAWMLNDTANETCLKKCVFHTYALEKENTTRISQKLIKLKEYSKPKKKKREKTENRNYSYHLDHR